ncbi:DUF2306 domain-containing protein, partial [Bacillus haynesii]|uniref:DUF2306 domain-containing protein n=2 Tax=Bacillaceae TaxID=186817 RepID=UPI00227F1C92
FSKHRNWMIRSYLFCFTNLFIHFITFVSRSGFGLPYDISYTIGVYGAIALNVAAAECVIHFTRRKAKDILHTADTSRSR